MTSFKDLFSKDELARLKSATKKTDASPPTDNKPDSTPLPNQKHIQREVQRLGAEYVDEDKVLFMQAMSGVKPLKHTPTVATTPQKDPNAVFKRAAATGTDSTPTTALSDMQALLNPVASEAFLSYKSTTLQTKVFEQLKQGKLRWYDAVDLHGSSIDDARSAILTLIRMATQAGETVVKIVHGKGNDALIKTCVNGWLRQMPEVLAFVSAPTKDGGTGAVLVLLKKIKPT